MTPDAAQIPLPSSAAVPAPRPARVVAADGTVAAGWFDRPIAEMNLGEAPVNHLFSFLRDGPLRGLERRWRAARLKRWHYSSVAGAELFCGAAVVDAGYLGKVFVYLVERRSGRCWEWERTLPAARGVRLSANSLDGDSGYQAPGFGALAFSNDSRRGRREISAELEAQRGGPALSLNIEIRDPGDDPPPVTVVERLAAGRWLYSHKCYGLEAGGRVQCGDLRLEIPMGRALAGLDWNYGYRLYRTFWNWAAGAGWDRDGGRIGFNLTLHARRPGRPAAHADPALDCALWLGSERVKLGRVEFQYAPGQPLQPWRIRDQEGLVDLEFRPQGRRVENIQLGVLASRFQQPYGSFHGVLRDRGGREAVLADVYGVTEEHYARW